MSDSSIQPNPLTDPIVPAIRSIALVAAQSMGMFSALADGPLPVEPLAKALGRDALGIERIAGVLTACGYLRRIDGCLALAEPARMTLLQGSPLQLTNWLQFCQIQLRAFEHLEDVLRDGRPVDLLGLMGSREALLTHQRAMAETAKPAADWVAANTPVPHGAKTMLDIGGSHGLYSAALCRANPPLRSDVLELPSVIDVARDVSREHSADAFVSYVEGDISSTTSLHHIYDLVFLGNIIHHIPRSEAPAALEKVAACTCPGGTVAIWDLREPLAASDATTACFSLFFYLTSGARCYAASEIRELLQASGYEDFREVRPPQTSTHALYTARRLDRSR